MTDAALPDAAPRPAAVARKSLLEQDTRTRRRNAAEARFRAYGLAAVAISILLLVFLLVTIVRNGAPAFTRTVVTVEMTLTQAQFDEAEAQVLKTAAYKGYLVAVMAEQLAAAGIDPSGLEASLDKIMTNTGNALRAHYRENPGDLGQPVTFALPAASRVDGYFKGRITRASLAESRFLSAADLDLVDAMVDQGIITRGINWTFLTGTDAAVDNPGGAGIGAAILGSFYMMMVVLVLSLPIGVAASIYLEEFAPRNRFTDFIEVNISNLAAVPSIVFGILGLAVFIQFAGLPQSAPLVGGLVLTLMTLPTIIIATRAALKAVPPSIREAALGVGASRMQAVFHHVLPLAMPGILTGTIIGLAQALGETAPLLLIGMVGFVAREVPGGVVSGLMEPNSAMPAQIYTWAARSDPAFYDLAWGGIIVLLLFMLVMNLIAIVLRRRFERRW